MKCLEAQMGRIFDWGKRKDKATFAQPSALRLMPMGLGSSPNNAEKEYA